MRKPLPMELKSRMYESNVPIFPSRMKKPYSPGCRQSEKDKQYRAEGAEEAQKIRSEAEKDKEIILAEAYKESEELRGAGDAKAFRIYADAYRQDPRFFEFTRSMEAYKKSFNEKSTLVMSPDSEFFRYLKKR